MPHSLNSLLLVLPGTDESFHHASHGTCGVVIPEKVRPDPFGGLRNTSDIGITAILGHAEHV